MQVTKYQWEKIGPNHNQNRFWGGLFEPQAKRFITVQRTFCNNNGIDLEKRMNILMLLLISVWKRQKTTQQKLEYQLYVSNVLASRHLEVGYTFHRCGQQLYFTALRCKPIIFINHSYKAQYCIEEYTKPKPSEWNNLL